MKKFWVVGAAFALILAVAAVAVAATNTYSVTASTTTAKAGSSKSPVPLGLKFNYTVGEVNNNRPDVIKKYSIFFAGLRTNNNLFPACTDAKLQANKDSCKSAIVGNGYVEAKAGGRTNEADQSQSCNLQLTLYNVRNNRLMLLLEGGPGESDTRRQCPLPFGASNGSGIIPANFVRTAAGTSLDFEVPENILHPIPSLSSAVKRVQSTVLRRTKRVKGKTRGYFESTGGCRAGKRNVRVTFTPESGTAGKASTTIACRK
jgi:hypothetical protein